MNWKIFGHKNVKNIIEKQLVSGSIPHAYLFFGVESIGKKTLALELAEKILKTDNLNTHPDFNLLDLSDGEIAVEEILKFVDKMSLKPFVGKKAVSVINDAHKLNIQSCNALLKTLEEPAESRVIILVSASKLLPTIVSRCQVFNFSCFDREDLKEFANELSLLVNPEILSLSFGMPGRLKKLTKEPSFLESQKAVVQIYEQILKQNRGERFAQITKLAELEETELCNNIKTWLSWQVLKLTDNPLAHVRVKALLETLEGISKNFNTKLALQGLFVKLS